MEDRRNPKYRCSGAAHQNAEKKLDKLKKLEACSDKRAADIALTVSNMFKFMMLSAAMLPKMELDIGILRLKVDDNGIFCGVRFPESRSHGRCDDVGRRNNAYVDDDEEGLLYDGD